MNLPHRPPCRSCADNPAAASSCTRSSPCASCASTGSSCTYPPPPPPLSAWTAAEPNTVQRWAETTRLGVGAVGGGRLRPKRDGRGEGEQFEWEEVVGQREDVRLRPVRRERELLFPATIDERGEAEQVDLVGDPLSFANDWSLLGGAHAVAPQDPLHPTILLNSTLRSFPTTTSGRITASVDIHDYNIGNTSSAAHIPLDPSSSCSATCAVWRRANGQSGRPTAVGLGTFAPLRPEQRVPSRKGKERAVNVDDGELSPYPPGAFLPSPAPLFSTSSPIQQLQLVSLPYDFDSSAPSALLAVRSLTSLSLLHLSLAAPFDPGIPPRIVSTYEYVGADLGRRPLADFALGGVSPSYGAPGGGLVVDTEGSLFGWGLGGAADWSAGSDRPEMFRLRKGRKRGSKGTYSGFAKVQYGGMNGCGAVVAVEDEVMLYDLRSPRASLTLVDSGTLSTHLPYGTSSPSLITSLFSRSPAAPSSLHPPPSAIHVVCTTRDILYLDERMTGRSEVLRIAHDRVGAESKGLDRTLSLVEVPSNGGGEKEEDIVRVALYSRLHPQIDIFTTSLNAIEAPRSVLRPYSLPSLASAPSTSSPSPSFTRTGLSILPLPPLPTSSSSVAGKKARDSMDLDGVNVDSSSSSDESDSPRSRGKERAAPPPPPPRWQMLEVGMRGEVYAREVRAGALADEEEDEEERGAVQGEAAAAWDERVEMIAKEAEEARRRRVKEDEDVKLEGKRQKSKVERDLSGVVERLRAVVVRAESGDAGVGGEDDAEVDVVARAAAMMRRATAQGEEEGDVGALTALEALSLTRQNPRPPANVMIDDDDEHDPPIPPLPRNSAYLARPSVSTSTLDLDDVDERLLSAPPSSLILRPTDPPTQFSTLLPQPFPAPLPTASDDSPSSRFVTDNVAMAASRSKLASRILLPRPIEPDEPTMSPNQPQPGDVDPPPLHFSYFRPKEPTPLNSDEEDEADLLPTSSGRRGGRRNRPRPTLEGAWGARLLLAEWHVGADPRSYAWSNPYEGEERKKDEAFPAGSQAQGGRKSRSRRRDKEKEHALFPPSSSQFEPGSQPFPSSFPAFPPSSPFPAFSSSQPRTPTFAPTFPSSFQPVAPPLPSHPAADSQSQSQDWSTLAATQPAISVTAPGQDFSLGSSQGFGFVGAASQVVPGAFGSRLQAIKEKNAAKKGKKRKAGF
ncbi:hypothetical protein JCM6882_005508 [Rhodosporidiobolus microsporus]